MNPDQDLLKVLRTLKARFGSHRRLASALGVTERAVTEWLREGSQVRPHPEHRDKILEIAREEHIQFGATLPAPVLWDCRLSYADNVSRAFELTDIGVLEPETPMTLWGRTLNSPFGAAASVATSTASRIRVLAHSCADVITYKTVRSQATPSHPDPNIYACTTAVAQAVVSDEPLSVVVDFPGPADVRNGLVNRFSVPSDCPQVWQADFQVARTHLLPNQMLILSIMGTAVRPRDTEKGLVEDFAAVARMGVEAGADVLEINSSCPNCEGREGLLYRDLPLLERVCRAVRAVAPTQRILLKIGHCSQQHLTELVRKTRSHVDGYVAINTVPVLPMRQWPTGLQPAFGSEVQAGLSGNPIRTLGIATVGALSKLRERRDDFVIVAVGGVSIPSHVTDYLNNGADVVQAASVFISDAAFGASVRRHLAIETRSQRHQLEAERRQAVMNTMVAAERMSPVLGVEAAHRLALSVAMEWQKGQLHVLNAGPRRASPVPSADELVIRMKRLNPEKPN